MFAKRYPLLLFMTLLMFIFFGEMGIMFVLDYIQDEHDFDSTVAFVDAAFLTSLSAPFFWFAFLRPLQRALDLESAKSNKIVEMAAEGIVSIDTQGKILSFNRAAQKIFGYSEAEIIGQNVRLLMPSPHRENHDGYLSHYLQTGQTHMLGKTRELDALRKDGSTFPMELSVTEMKLGDTQFFTAMLRDISEQKLVQQRIEQLAHYDDLTHLPNRSLFYDRLGQAITMAKRKHRSIALLFMDLDGFKQVNDTLGHHFGDALLGKVAERLSLLVRESDTLARLGGDEFTLIMSEPPGREAAALVAQKIIDSIGQPFDLDGNTVYIGVSVGIAIYPDDATARGALLIVADKAMYAAKAAGKNTFRFGFKSDATGSFRAFKSDV